MSRFGTLSLENIDKVVENTLPQNTKRSKCSVWSQFLNFCKEKNYKLSESTPKEKLVEILKDWGFNMKRINGEDYKEAVVKLMWNSTAKQLQEMYFKSFQIKFDPFADVEFACARAARDAKRRKLQEDPSKRKSSSIALTNQQLSRMAEVWDENTPTGLQRKFFLIAGYELAWRGGEGSTCCVHHFSEEKNNEGVSTGRVEYNPVFTKTTQGGSKKLADSKWLTVNTNNTDICPVR
jgi:hypothetical protein